VISRPKRHNDQHPGRHDAFDNQGQELFRRAIDPVDVLDDDDQRPERARMKQEGAQHIKRPCLDCLRTDTVVGRITCAEQPEQPPVRISRYGSRGSGRAHCADRVVGTVAVLDPAIRAYEVGQRRVRHEAAVGYAPSFENREIRHRVRELEQQPGLADAGLTDDACKLTPPGSCLRRKVREQPEFVDAANEWLQPLHEAGRPRQSGRRRPTDAQCCLAADVDRRAL
jgi:hypothetical protein